MKIHQCQFSDDLRLFHAFPIEAFGCRDIPVAKYYRRAPASQFFTAVQDMARIGERAFGGPERVNVLEIWKCRVE